MELEAITPTEARDMFLSEEKDAYDDEQQGLDDIGDSPEEVLEDSEGTATVSGDVVNQNAGHNPDEGDSDGTKVGFNATGGDENAVQYGNIPDELTEKDRWVCWRVKGRNGKPTKIPVNPHTGGRAKSDDADTWASFDGAREYHEDEATDTAGIGFMFSHNGRYAGIDLDDCVDPETGDVGMGAHKSVEKRAAELKDVHADYSLRMKKTARRTPQVA